VRHVAPLGLVFREMTVSINIPPLRGASGLAIAHKFLAHPMGSVRRLENTVGELVVLSLSSLNLESIFSPKT
jgi:hypothetical protein